MNTAWVILSRSAGSSRYRVTLSPMASGPLCTVVAELGRLLPCFAAGKVLQWQSLSTFSFQVHLRFWQVGVSVRDLSWCATVKPLPLQVNTFIPVTMTAIFSAPPLSATLSYLYTSCGEWMQMAPKDSYIWMLSQCLVLRRVRRGSLVRGGMSLGWVWDLRSAYQAQSPFSLPWACRQEVSLQLPLQPHARLMPGFLPWQSWLIPWTSRLQLNAFLCKLPWSCVFSQQQNSN